jgi:hypothetical protein
MNVRFQFFFFVEMRCILNLLGPGFHCFPCFDSDIDSDSDDGFQCSCTCVARDGRWKCVEPTILRGLALPLALRKHLHLHLPVVNTEGVGGKSSFKRLSDVLTPSGITGRKDLLFVSYFQRCGSPTGTTCLPLVAATNSRTTSLPKFQGKTKYAATGRRSAATKPCNLYKFIKVSLRHCSKISR